ncbi:uncharacterized protein LOC128555756 [Mercenaria mercenaria]|uniref:uncharacterized protein LOC128555756 n=1 Tax=Mercenaria mercenaria TaxID=6596 RepID=UPI00234E6ACB|nr:uncharacterized protein LOC128555756 [Mercenaria mercenaria]
MLFCVKNHCRFKSCRHRFQDSILESCTFWSLQTTKAIMTMVYLFILQLCAIPVSVFCGRLEQLEERVQAVQTLAFQDIQRLKESVDRNALKIDTLTDLINRTLLYVTSTVESTTEFRHGHDEKPIGRYENDEYEMLPINADVKRLKRAFQEHKMYSVTLQENMMTQLEKAVHEKDALIKNMSGSLIDLKSEIKSDLDEMRSDIALIISDVHLNTSQMLTSLSRVQSDSILMQTDEILNEANRSRYMISESISAVNSNTLQMLKQCSNISDQLVANRFETEKAVHEKDALIKNISGSFIDLKSEIKSDLDEMRSDIALLISDVHLNTSQMMISLSRVQSDRILLQTGEILNEANRSRYMISDSISAVNSNRLQMLKQCSNISDQLVANRFETEKAVHEKDALIKNISGSFIDLKSEIKGELDEMRSDIALLISDVHVKLTSLSRVQSDRILLQTGEILNEANRSRYLLSDSISAVNVNTLQMLKNYSAQFVANRFEIENSLSEQMSTMKDQISQSENLIIAVIFTYLRANSNIRLGDARVVGNGLAGRVEVRYNDQWGTVCDDFFTNISATVACQMAGFKRGVVTNGFGGGFGKIWLDNVVCTGSEINVFDCPRSHDRDIGEHDCGHSEDVGVTCF